MAQVETPQFRDLATNVNSHRGDRVFNRIITGLAFSALNLLTAPALTPAGTTEA